ncbi:DUF397 domain-containing protein [Sphaerisporangium sp. NPDC005288]|uniref:DUF397 domain-containing protein n=1 Tax=Sphaerisporangium sp. NPDC005288 TaxID=3155114 RepID=UPI0033BEE3D3
MEIANLTWRKSSYSSGNGGNCVEVASLAGGLAVRDSKNPIGPMLRFSSDDWRTFIRGLKSTELAGE